MTIITHSLDEAKAALEGGHPLRAAAALDELVYETWDPEELKAIEQLASPNGDHRGLLARAFLRDAEKEAHLRREHPEFRPAEFHGSDIVRR